jgi:hypothetical protein
MDMTRIPRRELKLKLKRKIVRGKKRVETFHSYTCIEQSSYNKMKTRWEGANTTVQHSGIHR